MKIPTPESGTLSYSNGMLTYNLDRTQWAIKASEIRMIGEYTTSAGPYFDDYFLVFLTAFDGGWYEASFYAEGREKALSALSEQLRFKLTSELCNSTDFMNRIVWPLKWNGQPFLEASPSIPKGIFSRLIYSGTTIPSKAMREIFSAPTSGLQ